MAKSAKSVGMGGLGLEDAISWAKETYEKAKDYVTTVDEGTLVDKLANRDPLQPPSTACHYASDEGDCHM